VALAAGLVVLAGWLAAQTASTPPVKVSRWESNLSLGYVSNKHISLIKSFWWFAVPKIFALGLSLDYVGDAIPFSLGVAVNAPFSKVVPFVCAGAGVTLTSGSITNYGGGVKFRLKRKLGLLVEFRRYHYFENTPVFPAHRVRAAANSLGFGISWLY
jgi:hypothetical protein